MADDRYQFQEQIDFFRQKVNLPTAGWTDIQHEEHDRSFVVAGAMRDDMLSDFRAAVDKAIAKGTTLAEFRKDFDTIVEKYGWTYNGGRNWRSKVIYETNLSTSYAAGRWKQVQKVKKTRPYIRYRHNDAVLHPRPLHVAWDGLVLPVDSEWVATHWPPNGWFCHCYIESLTEGDLKKLGKDGPDTPPPQDFRDVLVGKNSKNPRLIRTPAGVDPGFGYAPGKSWVSGLTPAPSDSDRLDPAPSSVSVTPEGQPVPAATGLPPPREVPASRVLPATLSDQEYIDAFLQEFGVSEGDRKTLFEDVTGEFLTISDDLFKQASGPLKVGKRDRASFLLLLADTIKAPDEIWAVMDSTEVRRRYVAQWLIAGEEQPTLAVFEWKRSEWTGVTAFAPEDSAYLDRQARVGIRVYRRGEE